MLKPMLRITQSLKHASAFTWLAVVVCAKVNLQEVSNYKQYN